MVMRKVGGGQQLEERRKDGRWLEFIYCKKAGRGRGGCRQQ
jgi:hypothetical protein